MVEAKDVAFVLHEEWRKTRLKEDGTYEPRWKSINDAKFIEELNKEELPVYVRKTEEGYEIDIANASYNLLSADWQNENKAAAEVVAGLVNSGKEFSRDEVGEIIHNAWLERNSWAKGGELGVPFAQLSKQEQDKDIIQYEIAKTMSEAKEVTGYWGNLENAARTLNWDYTVEGENVFMDFNGYKLYSKYDTIDTCFLKVCGLTLRQQRKFERELRAKLEERDRAERKEAEAKIPSLKERGEKLIYDERKEDWNRCVEIRVSDMYKGAEVELALKAMEALEEGKTVDEAYALAIDETDSVHFMTITKSIIRTFSKRGTEFARSVLEKEKNKYDEETIRQQEERIAKTEQENQIYAKAERARKVEAAKIGAAISTETTAEPIETKNKNKE